MLEGSLTTSRSTPFASMARRVLASRSAYSSRVNFRLGMVMLWSSSLGRLRRLLALKDGAGARRERAVAGERGDRGILNAGAGEVRDGDLAGGTAARLAPGDHLAELGDLGIGRDQPGVDGVVQLAEATRLPG